MPTKSFTTKSKSFAGGANMIIAACLVLVPFIIIWVLLGEFNILGLDYVHSEGGSTGQCFADATTATPVACADGTQVLLYPSSHVGWQMGLAAGLLVPWSVGTCLALWAMRLATPRVFPFAVATSFLGLTTCLSGALPHGTDGLIIFARVVMALVGTVIGFLLANIITNACILLTKRGGPVFEQIAEEIKESSAAKEKRLASKSKTDSDKDYVEDIKR